MSSLSQQTLRTDHYKTSDYGWRTNPVTGNRAFHSGTDYGGNIAKLYPPLPRPAPQKKKLVLGGALVLVAAVIVLLSATGVLSVGSLKDHLYTVFEKEQREGLAETALTAPEKKDVVQVDGVFESMLTEQQVLSIYENARHFFNDFDDNMARVEANKVLLSNASEPIKAKTKILLGYIDDTKPTYGGLKTNFSYAEVAAFPPIYQGCAVQWRGMAANIVNEQNTTAFDFLVGYDKRTEVAGIARVHCPFAAVISSETPLELLAAIRADATVRGGFTLTGVTVHQSPAIE
jgi:hypothetical protein